MHDFIIIIQSTYQAGGGKIPGFGVITTLYEKSLTLGLNIKNPNFSLEYFVNAVAPKAALISNLSSPSLLQIKSVCIAAISFCVLFELV